MLSTILKSAWRQIYKNKAFSAISLLGLVVGFSVAILSLLWVNDQLSYDAFHDRQDRIFQGMQNYQPSLGAMETYPELPFPMAEVLRQETPGVKQVAVTDWGVEEVLMNSNVRVKKTGNFVEADFLKIFTFPSIDGDVATALTEPNQIVLTAATAEALFGSTNVVGKTLELGKKAHLSVSAVLADIPLQSSLQFDFLLPYSLKMQLEPWMAEERNNWASHSYQLFFELEKGVEIEAIVKQHATTLAEHEGGTGSSFNAHALPDWHLYNTFENGVAVAGRMRNVQLFGIIGMLVLLIACINFINLSTSRVEKRRKEVAVRKTVGAGKFRLLSQFLGESGVLIGLAYLMSLLVVIAVLPAFNQLLDAQINLPWQNLGFWSASLLLIGGCVLLGGAYPAYFLSRLSAHDLFKPGSSRQAGDLQVWGRRLLVVTQFVVSIALIAGSMIVFKQVQYGQSFDAGYDKNRLINIPLSSDLSKNYTTVKQQLLIEELAQHVSRTSTPVTEVRSTTGGIRWPGSAEDEQADIAFIGVERDYFATLDLDILSGRTFNALPDTDEDAMIINEAALRRMNLENPLATVLQWDGEPHPIIGVVEDAIMESPFDPVRPTVYLKRNWRGPMLVRLTNDKPLPELISSIGAVIAQHDPLTPFTYSFVEETFAKKFNETQFLGIVMLAFAGLAILLSVLGLVGLAMYVVERKTKEVSIRKILGASVRQIWLLLSQEFLVLILIGGLAAIPLGAIILERWLASFTYRIDMPWPVFGLAIGLVLAIALVFISIQSLKAALINPADRLRDE